MNLKKAICSPSGIFLIIILAFAITFVSVYVSPRLDSMGETDDFIFKVIPIPFWIGVCVIATALFCMKDNLESKKNKIIFVFSSILLMCCMRMAFSIIFTSVPIFEPDALNYMTVVNSWVNDGVDFSVQGAYQHNYPLCFILGFVFVKLGVPLDTFFRLAPFAVFSLECIVLYLIVNELMTQKDSIIPAIAVFIFSFSSSGYWLSVHWCPDSLGSLLFFVCLFLGLHHAKSGSYTSRGFIILLGVIFLLILSHHLSTLYLIITFFGFAIASQLLKPKMFKGGALFFFILGVFTYTIWFVYGSLVYPDFFNVYVYFSGFSSITSQSVAAGWLNNAAFIVYPAFIILLFIIEFVRVTNLRPKMVVNAIRNPRKYIQMFSAQYSDNNPIVFAAGFNLVLLLFIVGIGVPALFGTRILEVLLVGLYPLSSISLIHLINTSTVSSRKRKLFNIIIFLIVLLVVIISIYRYYTQIQRRVIV